MSEVAWGPEVAGVRFGVRAPSEDLEAGGTIALEILCENRGAVPVWVFGFQPAYPRSLRVSPPRPTRPYIRISFADTNVLHPPDAFVRVLPKATARTWLDLSFAFDRRGAGGWDLAFAYDPVRGAGGIRALAVGSDEAPQTGVARIVVSRARSLREAGVAAAAERELDDALMAGHDVAPRLRALGDGGAIYAARRFARVLSGGTEAKLGWRALDALELLRERGLAATLATREEMPHAATALDFAASWIRFRLGHQPDAEHLPFVTALEQIVHQPDRRGNLVLSWTPYDSPVHGSCRMEIFGNGDRIVVVRPAGDTVPSTRRTLLGAMQMQTLLESLVFSGVWLLAPLRAQGLPDEPRPALELQLAIGEPFTRRIAMWNGEWRHGPSFRLADLLDRLAAAVRPESVPPPGR